MKNAENEMKEAISGEEQEAKPLSPQEMLAVIEAATEPARSYGDAGNLLAKFMLDFVRTHLPGPQALLGVPASDDIALGEGRSFDQQWDNRRVRTEGFDSLWKRLDPEGYRRAMDVVEPTGFMYGWAYNAVRYVCELGPVQNPAIVELTVSCEQKIDG